MDMETKSLCNLLPHVDPSVSITAGILSGARFAKKAQEPFQLPGLFSFRAGMRPLKSLRGCRENDNRVLRRGIDPAMLGQRQDAQGVPGGQGNIGVLL